MTTSSATKTVRKPYIPSILRFITVPQRYALRGGLVKFTDSTSRLNFGQIKSIEDDTVEIKTTINGQKCIEIIDKFTPVILIMSSRNPLNPDNIVFVKPENTVGVISESDPEDDMYEVADELYQRKDLFRVETISHPIEQLEELPSMSQAFIDEFLVNHYDMLGKTFHVESDRKLVITKKSGGDVVLDANNFSNEYKLMFESDVTSSEVEKFKWQYNPIIDPEDFVVKIYPACI